MVNPWVHDTLVRKSYKWRLREACELGAKHSRGVQTDAAEDALWSQWGAANPKKTEALRRRRWSLRVSPLLPITANVEQLLDCLGDETDFELRSLQIGICQTLNGSKFQESNGMSRITIM